ncbi:hypothetical protein CVT25_007810 [Psilocybe cyanescens]|uniref:Uncharacterized protein n=1 Tax=Psilocybe cyanescens TaxID=93625 RepID=A0A409XT70_PSICY|nr:hypothetical protein CVT25_007810 [Psilocybe cyanescens]
MALRVLPRDSDLTVFGQEKRCGSDGISDRAEAAGCLTCRYSRICPVTSILEADGRGRDQVTTRIKAIVLKQDQRLETVYQELEAAFKKSDGEKKASEEVKTGYPWWSRGRQGLQWKRNRDGIPEVVE